MLMEENKTDYEIAQNLSDIFVTSGGVELKLKLIPHALIEMMQDRLAPPVIDRADPNFVARMEEFRGRNVSFLLSFGLVNIPIDTAAVEAIKESLTQLGMQPVLSDWAIYVSSVLITDNREFLKLIQMIKAFNNFEDVIAQG